MTAFFIVCSFRRGVRLNLIFAVLLCLTALTRPARRRRGMSTGHTFPQERERSCRWRFFVREKYNRLPVDQNTRRRNNPTRRLSASKDLFIISILLYQFLKVRSNDLTLYINLIYNNSRRTLYGNRKKN